MAACHTVHDHAVPMPQGVGDEAKDLAPIAGQVIKAPHGNMAGSLPAWIPVTPRPARPLARRGRPGTGRGQLDLTRAQLPALASWAPSSPRGNTLARGGGVIGTGSSSSSTSTSTNSSSAAAGPRSPPLPAHGATSLPPPARVHARQPALGLS